MTEIIKPADALKGSVPYSLKLSLKLAELEKQWQEVVGTGRQQRGASRFL